MEGPNCEIIPDVWLRQCPLQPSQGGVALADADTPHGWQPGSAVEVGMDGIVAGYSLSERGAGIGKGLHPSAPVDGGQQTPLSGFPARMTSLVNRIPARAMVVVSSPVRMPVRTFRATLVRRRGGAGRPAYAARRADTSTSRCLEQASLTSGLWLNHAARSSSGPEPGFPRSPGEFG